MGLFGSGKKKKDGYEDVYNQFENSGFEFNYGNRHISKSKIIFQEQMDAISSGKHNNDMMFVHCRKCGCYMDFESGPDNCLDGIWKCPVCGTRVKESTAYHQLDRENMEWENSMADFDDMPECCEACGGPWPDCEASCKLFDD